MQLRLRVVFAFTSIALLLLAPPVYASKMVRGSESSGNNGHASKSRAPENGDRGMNRVSPEGSWKSDGHRPSSNSDPQGQAPSNPDAGGFDKPGGSQGASGDQDGNNGCGNDLDREDDNNGWCGRPPELPRPSPSPSVSPTASPAPSLPPVFPEILPSFPSGVSPTVVLGGRANARGTAQTGADVLAMLFGGLTFVAIGVAARRRSARA